MDSFFNSASNMFGLGGNSGRGQTRPNGQAGQRPNTTQAGARGRQADPYAQQVNAQWNREVDQFETMLIDMGMQGVYSRQQMLYALQATGGNQEKALDYLLNQASAIQAQPEARQGGGVGRNGANLGSMPSGANYQPSGVAAASDGQGADNSEFAQLQTALAEQQQELFQQVYQNRKANNYEPLPVNERARAADTPSGLKNIGNTCYFSSLVQTLFFLPNIQEKILNHDASQVVDPPEAELKKSQGDGNGKDGGDEENDTKLERAKLVASKEVVAGMQALFAEMLQSNRKYADPTRVLGAIVDNNGAKLTIYEQKDIGEFFQIFLERLQDGLGENKAMVRKLMSQDLVADIQLTRQKTQDLIDLAGDTQFQVSINGDFTNQQEMQSMLDPTKKTQLMNYDLDTFQNSIWENFIGSQVQLSLLYEADGTSKVTQQNIDKMGPVQLQISEGSGKLYSAWEASRKSEVEGFKGEKEGQRKVLETWICRPPNVMMFQINRVTYDYKNQKLVKDNSRFEFDKEIYLDLFLNKNKDAAYKHYERLDQMRADLKILKDTYEKYTKTSHPLHEERIKLIDVLSTAEAYLQTGGETSNKKNKLHESIVIDNEQVDFFDPVQLSQSEFGVSMQEIQIACNVLAKFRSAAQQQTNKLEKKIADMEKVLEKPYVEGGKHPYYLHSIMIHDGLAENGHYYTYVYDRVLRHWWKLDDHRVSIADEETVMKEALGGDGYKSACNLFYISKHVSDMIEEHKHPLFDMQRAREFSRVPSAITSEIREANLTYQMQLQQFEAEKRVNEIMKVFHSRMQKLDENATTLEQLVDLKIFSFYYYLKSCKLRGYGKWTVLCQCVKEQHPQNLSLLDIIKSNVSKEDDIIKGLLNQFSENFLQLTPAEDAALLTRQCEFKDLQKKAILITHMMMNLTPRGLKGTLKTFKFYLAFIKDLQAKHEQNYKQRMQDWDQYGNDIIQIFMVQLMISMMLNYKDDFRPERDEAFKCMQLLSVMATQFTSQRKSPYRQFDTLFATIAMHYSKLQGTAVAEGGIDPNAVTKLECERVVNLFQKFRTNTFTSEEKILLVDSADQVPHEVQKSFEKIDNLDIYEYKDGVDPESASYQFFNSLNEFRIQHRLEIQVHETVIKRQDPCSDAQFMRLLQDLQMDREKYKKRKLFDVDFVVESLFGAESTNLLDLS